LFDPRQHAIGLTCVVEIIGIPVAHGEALEFNWFDINDIPGDNEIGFGQKSVINECVRRAQDRGTDSGPI
jgi:hypothetical protein